MPSVGPVASPDPRKLWPSSPFDAHDPVYLCGWLGRDKNLSRPRWGWLPVGARRRLAQWMQQTTKLILY